MKNASFGDYSADNNKTQEVRAVPAEAPAGAEEIAADFATAAVFSPELRRAAKLRPLPASAETKDAPLPAPGAALFRSPENQRINQIWRERHDGVVLITAIDCTVDPYSLEPSCEATGFGSGVILDVPGDRAILVTNVHVAGNASLRKVTLTNGESYPANVLYMDPRLDLAYLEIEGLPPGAKLTKVPLGDPGRMIPGDTVVAIGNPLGQQDTLTAGLISYVGDKRHPNGTMIKGILQTQTPINPGNSGGGLFDMNGGLIGVNTWIASKGGGSDGIGFAVPSNYIKEALKRLMNENPKKLEIPDLGVEGIDTFFGPMVWRVTGGELAERSSLTPAFAPEAEQRGYDFVNAHVIKEVNHMPVSTMEEIEQIYERCRASKQAVIPVTVRPLAKHDQNGADKAIDLKCAW